MRAAGSSAPSLSLHRRSTVSNATSAAPAASGSPVSSLLAHPGYTATHLQTSSPTGLVKLVFGTVLRPLAQRPEAGALPQLYAATAPEARSGDLIGPDGRGELRGAPTRVELGPSATDTATGRRLWEVSEGSTGVRFRFPGAG